MATSSTPKQPSQHHTPEYSLRSPWINTQHATRCIHHLILTRSRFFSCPYIVYTGGFWLFFVSVLSAWVLRCCVDRLPLGWICCNSWLESWEVQRRLWLWLNTPLILHLFNHFHYSFPVAEWKALPYRVWGRNFRICIYILPQTGFQDDSIYLNNRWDFTRILYMLALTASYRYPVGRCWPGSTFYGDDARFHEFLTYGSVEKAWWTPTGHRWGVCVVQASFICGIFLLGTGYSASSTEPNFICGFHCCSMAVFLYSYQRWATFVICVISWS